MTGVGKGSFDTIYCSYLLKSFTTPTIFFIAQVQLHGVPVVAKSLHVEYSILLQKLHSSFFVAYDSWQPYRKLIMVRAGCGRIRIALSFMIHLIQCVNSILKIQIWKRIDFNEWPRSTGRTTAVCHYHPRIHLEYMSFIFHYKSYFFQLYRLIISFL